MDVSVGKEFAELEELAVGQVREMYAEVFGDTPTAGNKPLVPELGKRD